MKRFALAVLALCVLTLPANAGLLDKFRGGRGGGGDDPCADGSCGRPIGMGLKKPGQEVGHVSGDGMFVKMYGQQPEQPQYDQPQPQPADRSGINPIFYLLACSPMALLIPAVAGVGAYVVIRKAQESADD
jgi:hypothetical protein